MQSRIDESDNTTPRERAFEHEFERWMLESSAGVKIESTFIKVVAANFFMRGFREATKMAIERAEDHRNDMCNLGRK